MLERATVTWADGLTAVFAGDDLEDGTDLTHHPDAIFGPGRAIARSIILTLRIFRPEDDQPRPAFEVPADMLCLGYRPEHTTFIAAPAWPEAEPRDIARIELEALFSEREEYDNRDPQEVLEELAVW